ncbi:Rrp15p-domain-containing protein [Xylogone sp. PMI_703]|nr:Rrp15p-domain-containing protein [Xylogone sp. PMI_703]
MAGQFSKKRKVEDGMKGKITRPVKKFKKQAEYHSDSSASDSEDSQDFQAVNLQDMDDEVAQDDEFNAEDLEDEDLSEDGTNAKEDTEAESEVTDASNSDSEDGEDTGEEEDSDANSNSNTSKKRKRNDPEAFATSMSKILGSKLSSSKRSDPVLSRSVTAIQASKEITDAALEKKAKHKLREEKRAALDKGRVRDILGASTAFDAAHSLEGGETRRTVSETMEIEKRLRKTAQRGVVKLFNAVRAAQIKGEQAAKEARSKGVVGQGSREEKVNEMSKQGFLELIAGGGGLKAGSVSI